MRGLDVRAVLITAVAPYSSGLGDLRALPWMYFGSSSSESEYDFRSLFECCGPSQSH